MQPRANRKHRPGQAAEATREGERPAQEDCGGKGAGSFDPEGSCGGKLLSPAGRRDAVEHVRRRLGVSERRACRVLKQSRTTQRYVPRQPDDEQVLTERIVNLAREYGRYGYRRVTALLRMEGWLVNHKRVQRIWRREGLKVPKKQPKRARLWLNDGSCIRLRPENKDHVWAYDFVHHRTHDGRAMRLLTIVDEYTRESLAIDVARKLNSEDVLHRPEDDCSFIEVFQRTSGQITDRNSPPRRFATGWAGSASARCLSSRAPHGRTAMWRASTASSETSC